MRKVLFIFSVLSDSDVSWLAQVGERVRLEPGTVLVPLGSRVEFIYFVLDGRLRVRAPMGETLNVLEAGEVIGEMSLVDPAPTVVSVEVETHAALLRIPDHVVREKLRTDTAFAARFYRALCVFMADRMRHTTQRLGYGPIAAAQDAHAKDELNDILLDHVHLAGARFDRMLKRLAG
jgi:CRP-like cAMP-binding protein